MSIPQNDVARFAVAAVCRGSRKDEIATDLADMGVSRTFAQRMVTELIRIHQELRSEGANGLEEKVLRAWSSQDIPVEFVAKNPIRVERPATSPPTPTNTVLRTAAVDSLSSTVRPSGDVIAPVRPTNRVSVVLRSLVAGVCFGLARFAGVQCYIWLFELLLEARLGPIPHIDTERFFPYFATAAISAGLSGFLLWWKFVERQPSRKRSIQAGSLAAACSYIVAVGLNLIVPVVPGSSIQSIHDAKNFGRIDGYSLLLIFPVLALVGLVLNKLMCPPAASDRQE